MSGDITYLLDGYMAARIADLEMENERLKEENNALILINRETLSKERRINGAYGVDYVNEKCRWLYMKAGEKNIPAQQVVLEFSKFAYAEYDKFTENVFNKYCDVHEKLTEFLRKQSKEKISLIVKIKTHCEEK